MTHCRARRRWGPFLAVLLGGLLTLAGTGPVSGTVALFWDTSTVTSGAVSAYAVPRPATFTCGAIGVASVTFTWAAVPRATSYTLHYGTNGTQTLTVTGTSGTVPALVTTGTAWVVANQTFTADPANTWSSVASVTRTYRAVAVTTCS